MSLTSPNAQLFVAVQNRLKEKVTALKWIDQNFGQLDNYELKPPVLFPCGLIDLSGFSFEDLPNGKQRANGRVVIILSTTPFSNSNASTPEPQKKKHCSTTKLNMIYITPYIIGHPYLTWKNY
ncbi:MAG: hypothetical protein IPP48_03300 [Chitinophagaceae bacterium]|nr:hypothetical protein [Chitinophagaceae bacterium]